MSGDLFGDEPVNLAGAILLRRFAAGRTPQLNTEIARIAAAAPFRRMMTPGGKMMSVAMTSCGIGWITDRRGYRYEPLDPANNSPWPAMPAWLADLAKTAAAHAGFADFAPDACLINCYTPGARMALHQDQDERDFAAPIVSVSLGLPAVFLWGGQTRGERPMRMPLESGDVVVWGGVSRLNFHGIAPLRDGNDPLFGQRRINLTFRKAR